VSIESFGPTTDFSMKRDGKSDEVAQTPEPTAFRWQDPDRPGV